MSKLVEARAQGQLALEAAAAVPVVEEAPSQGALGALNGGTLRGLMLATKTVDVTIAELDREGPKVDPRLLRAGLDAGLSMARLSMRAAENEFQRRKGDAVERLLEAIAAETLGKQEK